MNPVVRWFHQLGSPPYFDRFAARWAPWASGTGLLVLAWGIWQGLFVAPADYQPGDSFRILYVHVPSAWMSLAVFGLMAVYAAIALVWRIKPSEILSMAYAPIGAGFTLTTLAPEIGSAHVCTPGTTAQPVCRPTPETQHELII